MSRILLIEDDERSSERMRDLLALQGHEVIFAITVADARQRLRSTPLDVVLTELRLPDASGEDLLAEIRADAALSYLPVVAVTTAAKSTERERLMTIGFDGCINKPISTRSLEKDVAALTVLGDQRRFAWATPRG